MGVCGSSNNRRGNARNENEQLEMLKNKDIDRTMAKYHQEDETVFKLLLLGAGESGKSTLFKQLVHIYGKGFDEEARQPYASIIHTYVIVGMRTLIKESDALSKTDPTFEVSSALLGSKNFMQNEVKSEAPIDEKTAQHIKFLWKDPAIKRLYTMRSQFQLSDSVSYFFDKIDSVGQENYVPTYQDILQVRSRTTGIVETSLYIQNYHFKVVDVGGQRNERKKWIHCFENVTAVMFVVAINEYDQVLYEDGTTNRLHEAINLFAEMCNCQWFRNTSMILFLNKKDLFHEKIQRVNMAVAFTDYTGGCNYDNALSFLTLQFLNKNEYPTKKQIYVHVTCATDTENMQFTFHVVKDIILKSRLNECVLID